MRYSDEQIKVAMQMGAKAIKQEEVKDVVGMWYPAFRGYTTCAGEILERPYIAILRVDEYVNDRRFKGLYMSYLNGAILHCWGVNACCNGTFFFSTIEECREFIKRVDGIEVKGS